MLESLMLFYTAVTTHPSSSQIPLFPVPSCGLSLTSLQDGDMKTKLEGKVRKKCSIKTKMITLIGLGKFVKEK